MAPEYKRNVSSLLKQRRPIVSGCTHHSTRGLAIH